MQGKAHSVQVKEPYGNSNWLLIGLHPATRSVHCIPSVSCPPMTFRRNGKKKERKTVFYAIARKNLLFWIFHIMIWIVLKYCFC